MKAVPYIAVVIMLSLAVALPALAAETRYVKDTIVIGVRNAPSDLAKSLEFIRTGDKVKVIDEEGDFILVRTARGTEGWVKTRYTVTKRPAAAEASELRNRNEIMQGQIKQAEESSVELSDQLRETREQVEALNVELTKARTEYNELAEMNEHVLDIAAERDMLKERVRKYREESGIFSGLMDVVSNRGFLRWFLAGGGVFLAGWLAGRSAKKQRFY
jgi:SH3 domain protein